MKVNLVNESMSFHRGGDHKRTLGIGEYDYFQNHLPGFKEAKDEFEYFNVVGYFEYPKHPGVYIFLLNFPADGADTNGLCAYYSNEKRWADIPLNSRLPLDEPATLSWYNTSYEEIIKKYNFTFL